MRPLCAVVLVPACLCTAGCDSTGPEITDSDIFTCEFHVAYPRPGWDLLVSGDTARATVVARYSNGELVLDFVPEWSSRDSSIVTVDSAGLLTAHAGGYVVVDASHCSGALGIEVLAPPTRLHLLPGPLALLPGNHALVLASFDGYDAPEPRDSFFVQFLTWRSDAPTIARTEQELGDAWWGGTGAEWWKSVEALEEGSAAIIATVWNLEDTLPVGVARAELGPPVAGSWTAFAVGSDASVYCWPCFVSHYPRGRTTGPAPVRAFSGISFVRLSAGGSVCGLTAAGALYCAGSPPYGAYADSGPTAISPGTSFNSVSVGATHACARAVDGAVSCWGWNDEDQLGVDSTGEICDIIMGKELTGQVPCSTAPRALDVSPAFATVGAGASLSCGLTGAGTLYCWGHHYGLPPVQVGDGTWYSLALGGRSGQPFNCALDAQGGASCWGSAPAGLGDGAATESWTPVAVAGGHAFIAVSVGSTACGLTGEGDVYCWGGVDADHQPPLSALPQLVGGGITFTSIDVGDGFACGYGTDGDVWCWGSNLSGQLGVPGAGVPGGTDYAATPVKVLGQK